jgi:hypothetical protein
MMEEMIESEKLENLLNQMKQVPVLSGSNLNNFNLKSTMPKSMQETQQNEMLQGTDFDKSKLLIYILYSICI